jgi:hypothetical protein
VNTGHPFGFHRCIVHDDGHVVYAGTGDGTPAVVEATHALLTEVGLTAYHLAWLPDTDLARLYLAGQACDGCRIRVSCGCDVVQEVLTGRCPHGTRKAIMAAAKRCGYLDAVPPPADTQAGMDAYATAIVQLDAAQRNLAGANRRQRRHPDGKKKGRRDEA